MNEFPSQLDPLQKAQITEVVLPREVSTDQLKDADYYSEEERIFLYVEFITGQREVLEVTREKLSSILYPSGKLGDPCCADDLQEAA